jgi:hypothetical protein
MYALRNVRQLALDGTKWPLREWVVRVVEKRYRRIPPSCSSTRFPVETLIRIRERSSTTRMSFLPKTWSVGVAYPSPKTAFERGPGTLNPDTAMQNLLRRDVRHNGNTSIISRSIARKCDIQRWVRRLAVHEERWMGMWPLKLRNIPSTISSLGLSAEEKKSLAAQEPLGGPPLPHLDCREHENRDQIVSARVLCGLAKPHLNPKTPYKMKKKHGEVRRSIRVKSSRLRCNNR